MRNLIKSEFFKISKSSGIKIFTLFMFLFNVALGFLIIFSTSHSKNFNSLGTLKQLLTNVEAIFIFVAIFASMFFGSDFENKTINNKIAIGNSRRAIFSSKIIVFYTTSIFFILAHPVIVFLMDLFYTRNMEIITKEEIFYGIKLILFCLPIYFAMISIIVLISFLLYSASKIITVSILFILLKSLPLQLMEYVFPGSSDIYKYSPFALIYELAYSKPGEYSLVIPFISSLSYIIIFISISYIIFRKKDF